MPGCGRRPAAGSARRLARRQNRGRGGGNPWLAATLGNIAAAAARTDTFLGARYRRLARRRGKQIAIVAIGNTLLTIAYHLLAEPEARFHDLGVDHYESRISKERHARNLATQLQAATGQRSSSATGKLSSNPKSPNSHPPLQP
ncbi:hypothetical protein [Actinopolymorpha pittospori]|uniref:Transposase IS116/IS110/IS902 family protein n=1 Tax=Actinopolymorpha pittospori TaxID=648752 RepID=A0A927RHK3_9ACTN|nr:hypothetical protein [Actinopolymorpha pittospori]MBE1603558.1 hypothetical protein [Actinopolymorpha pittospori]